MRSFETGPFLLLALLITGQVRAEDTERDAWLVQDQPPSSGELTKQVYAPLDFTSIRRTGNDEDVVYADGRELELITAAERNDWQAVKSLIAQGANPNRAADEWGKRALLLAVRHGNVEMVRVLLEGGADPDLKGMGRTPLELAAMKGQKQIVSQLLRAGADVDLRSDNGQTPLTAAATFNHLGVIQVLLAARPDLSLSNKEGLNPMGIAAMEGFADALRMMLEAGADPNELDRFGNRPMNWAIFNDKRDTIRLLVDYGGVSG